MDQQMEEKKGPSWISEQEKCDNTDMLIFQVYNYIQNKFTPFYSKLQKEV